MANAEEKSKTVHEIQETYSEVIVGKVVRLTEDEKRNLRVEIRDQGTWIVPAGISVQRFRDSFQGALDRQQNILFFASATTRHIGDIAASTIGLPLLDETSQLEETLSYAIFPSPRFYYLKKTNPRFSEVKNKISSEIQRTGGSPANPQLTVYYLSDTGEIIDVRLK